MTRPFWSRKANRREVESQGSDVHGGLAPPAAVPGAEQQAFVGDALRDRPDHLDLVDRDQGEHAVEAVPPGAFNVHRARDQTFDVDGEEHFVEQQDQEKLGRARTDVERLRLAGGCFGGS